MKHQWFRFIGTPRMKTNIFILFLFFQWMNAQTFKNSESSFQFKRKHEPFVTFLIKIRYMCWGNSHEFFSHYFIAFGFVTDANCENPILWIKCISQIKKIRCYRLNYGRFAYGSILFSISFFYSFHSYIAVHGIKPIETSQLIFTLQWVIWLH